MDHKYHKQSIIHCFFFTVLGISLAALTLVLVVGLFISYRIYRKRQIIKHYNLDNESGELPEGEKLLPDALVIT